MRSGKGKPIAELLKSMEVSCLVSHPPDLGAFAFPDVSDGRPVPSPRSTSKAPVSHEPLRLTFLEHREYVTAGQELGLEALRETLTGQGHLKLVQEECGVDLLRLRGNCHIKRRTVTRCRALFGALLCLGS